MVLRFTLSLGPWGASTLFQQQFGTSQGITSEMASLSGMQVEEIFPRDMTL
jgi:hypothetical protein